MLDVSYLLDIVLYYVHLPKTSGHLRRRIAAPTISTAICNEIVYIELGSIKYLSDNNYMILSKCRIALRCTISSHLNAMIWQWARRNFRPKIFLFNKSVLMGNLGFCTQNGDLSQVGLPYISVLDMNAIRWFWPHSPRAHCFHPRNEIAIVW